MSLSMLFDGDTVEEMMKTWPNAPAVYEVPTESQLPDLVSAEILNGYLQTGTAPADDVIVIRDGAALHPRAYTTAGRLDATKIAKWRARGYSFQLRNVNRWYPPLHEACAAIQQETGYGNYVTGFVTPAEGQALTRHWDQNMGFIYQVAGRKTWQIWEPVVEEPHRDHLACNSSPGRDLLHGIKTSRPHRTFDLVPGQVLVLPRGWVHNVHTRGQQQESVHLTFVVRERTGLWISERLTRAAITNTALRRVIPPARLVDPAAFAEEVSQIRWDLAEWLNTADDAPAPRALLDQARTEHDVDYP